MEAGRLSDPSAFLTAAGPFLLADEARHNLILGIAGTLRDQPGYYPGSTCGLRRTTAAAW